MQKPIIAIIGAGNMGASLISGLMNNNNDPNLIWAVDPATDKLDKLHQQFNIQITSDINQALAKATVVLFAIKPQLFKTIVLPIKATLAKTKPLLISIAAGISLNSLQTWLGNDMAIVRAMPNTPALIGCGVTALFSNTLTTLTQRMLADQILQAVGTTVWVDEEKWLDIVTALSGSGPAYFFYMMEALEQSATALGLPKELSHSLTLQTAYGAALMALESNLPLATLRQQVTSPGGTTEKALSIMEENQLATIFKKAVAGAKLRAEELATMAEQNND